MQSATSSRWGQREMVEYGERKMEREENELEGVWEKKDGGEMEMGGEGEMKRRRVAARILALTDWYGQAVVMGSARLVGG